MRRSVALLLATLMAGVIAPAASADRGFTARFTANDTGDIALAAAPLMTCPAAAANCLTARGQGAGEGPAGSSQIASQNNNAYTMGYVDTDGDTATTINSSTASLSLPAGATVLFAGLYWGADDSAGATGAAPPAGSPPRGQAEFKVPNGTYAPVVASVVDVGTGPNTNRYQAFADVTAAVAAAGGGSYALGDVRAATGQDRYAGWSLVVAYRDTAQPARNLSVFDGFKTVVSNSPPTSIAISGFRTPPAGPVRTTVGFVAYEGDLGLGGDTATLNSTTLGGPANQATNFFNSSISAGGANVTTRDPAFRNTLGYDADLFRADAVLANDATDATIRLTTSADQYLPGVITFATELFAPKVTLAKSVTNVTRSSGLAQRGDVLRYTVVATNTGQDGADDFRLTDRIPTGSTYVAESLRITAGTGSPASPSDAPGDDRGDFDPADDEVTFRLGAGGDAVTGGRLAAQSSASVSFDVRVGQVAPRTEIVNVAASSFLAQSLRAPLTADSNVVTTEVAAPDLTLDKAHAPGFVAGAASTYRLIVSNAGTLATDSSEVIVTDVLPAAAFAAASNPGGDGWACALAGLELRCTRSDVLAAGESYPPILVDVRVRDPAPGSVVNTGQVQGGGDADTTNNSATDVGGTAQRADLRVAKSVTPDTALSGTQVTYTLAVENLGPSTATAAVVDDPIAAGLGSVEASSTRGSCDTSVRCALGDLAPGESAVITVTATITANATTLENTATVASPTPDPTPANNTSSAQVTVPNTADLRIAKSPSTPTPVAGAAGGLSYALTITNDGPGPAAQVQVVDDLSPLFTPTTVTASPGLTCNAPAAGGRLVCSGPSLAAGASATVTVEGTVADAAAATFIDNTARVSTTTGDRDPTNDDASARVLATPATDLATTKEWGTETPPFSALTATAPGATVRIRLTATNNGPSGATGVTLADLLPANVTYLSDDQAACSASGQAFRCAIGPLAGDAQFVVLVTVRVETTAGGSRLTNTATVDGDQGDPIASNDTATARLSVTPAADLSLLKRASVAGPATVGELITYTLVATNNGPNDATATQVTDTLPTGLEFVSSADGCTAAAAVVTCALGTLAPAATATRDFVVRVTRAGAGRRLVNAATVASALTDPEPSNNDATAEVVVGAQSDLRLAKTVADATPGVDQDVTYSLTVTNDGPNDATAVTVSDPLAPGVAFVAAGAGCSYVAASRTVTCDVGALTDGASASRTITVRPTASVAGQTVTNLATVRGAEEDPDPSDNRAQVDLSVQPQVDLSIAKSADAPSVQAGGTLTYTLVIANAGPSPATQTLVSDPLPDGTTAISAIASQGSCTTSAAGVSCALGTVPAGGTAQIVIVVAVDAAGAGRTLVNLAAVDAQEADARPQDNRASVQTPVTAPPAAVVPAPAVAPAPAPAVAGAPPGVDIAALAITKRVQRRVPPNADELVYTVEVTNTSTVPARDVRVTDTFSAAATVLSVRTTAGSCRGVRPVTCSLGVIAPGARAVITIVARPGSAATLRNTATVTAANDDDRGAVAPATADATPPTARLTVAKTANRSTVAAAATVDYRITVRNISRVRAFDVRVCDRLPSGLTFGSARGARIRGREACWRVGTLRGRASRTFRLVARADRLDRGRRATNVARADGDNTRAVRASAPVRIQARGASRAGGVTG